jgi:chromosomal replication initiator protein
MDDSDRLSVLRDALRRRVGVDRVDFWLGSRTRLEFSGHALRVICASRLEMQWLRRRLHHALVECCVALWSPPPTITYIEHAAEPQSAPCRAAHAHHSAKRSTPPLPLEACRTADEAQGAMATALSGHASPSMATPGRGHSTLPPTHTPGEARGVGPQGAMAAALNGHVLSSMPTPPGRGHGASTPGPVAARRTFANFTFGPGNQVAAAAAHDLALQPGRFTPLLVHGPPGCGKTHLLEAIGPAARVHRGRVRALLITAEQFTAQFIDALNARSLPGFRQKTRSVDLLLVDDVQFLENKKATLEELLYTIDALHGRQGQIVLTSDRPVDQLHAFSPELASRIAAGLVVAVDLPDFATRRGIVRHTADRLGVALDDEVVELIARQVVGSARLLSGAINRLVAAARAAGQSVTRELAEAELVDFCRQHAPQVRLADIQRALCEEFGVEPAVLRSQRRTRAAAEPRMLCMWLARRFTRAALSEIGEFFGGRRHSTVVSANHKIDDLLRRGADVTLGDRPWQVEEAVRRIEARLRTG